MSRGDAYGSADDGADWLLAQLASGRAPERPVPPVAPPPAAQAPPAEPVAPPVREPAPRREEVLDWFSLAEPASASDAATRALPVIGAPTTAQPPAPAEPPTAPPPAAAPAGLPSWNPPFAVNRPTPPAAAPSSYPTQVEPPVGAVPPGYAAPPQPGYAAPPQPGYAAPGYAAPAQPGYAAPAQPGYAAPAQPGYAAPPQPGYAAPPQPGYAAPPQPGYAAPPQPGYAAPPQPGYAAPPQPGYAAPPQPGYADPMPPVVPPAAPTAAVPPVVPGPVTPTAPFALTWRENEADSEASLRAAFRALSEPAGAASATPAAAPPIPPAQPPAPAPSSFAEFAPPPVDRQSFAAVQPEPPQHPTAPANAPATWDERAARAAPATNYDAELWAALHEPEPTAPAAPAAQPAPAEQRTAPPRDRFAAYGLAAADPFAALTATPASAQSAAAPVAQPGPVAPQEPAAPATAAPPFAAPLTAPRRPTFGTGTGAPPTPGDPNAAPDPFFEVRGAAAPPVTDQVGTPARESSVNGPAPFPAFTPSNNGNDDLTRERPATVDDVLASLGGAPRSRDALPPARMGAGMGTPTAPAGFDAPPTGFDAPPAGFDAPPTGFDAPPAGFDAPSTGFDALGLVFDETGAIDRPKDDFDGRGGRGTLFGRGGHDDAYEPVEPPAPPISHDAGEPGYFWNLTPDPSATDPNANVDTDTIGVHRPVPFPAAGLAIEPEAGSEFGAEPDWAFVGAGTAAFPAQPETPTVAFPVNDARTTAFPQPLGAPQAAADDAADPLAALFGGAAAAGTGPVNDPFAAVGARGGSGDYGASATLTAAGDASAYRRGTPSPAPDARGSYGGAGAGRSAGGSGGGEEPGGNRSVRTLIWVAGSLVVVLVLAGLFYLGTQLAGGGGGSPSAAGTPSASETPVAAPTAVQPVGVHAWNTLFGGECVEPFGSVWDQEFTVVDCAAPHAAQLVYRGTLPGDAAAPFPGEEALGAQMAALCTADGVIDIAAASANPGLQVQGSFPVTEEQWAAGERTFYCFANRAGGEQITGTLQGPGPAA